MLPKILLLSKQKNNFEGLIFPSEDDVDAQRRDNAVKIREQLNQLNQAKGNELYLEWLERNQDNVDLVNRKISLNLQTHDQALQYSNDQNRSSLKKQLV